MKQQNSMNYEKANSLTIDSGMDPMNVTAQSAGSIERGRTSNLSVNSERSHGKKQKGRVSHVNINIDEEKINEDAEALIREVTDLHKNKM